MIPFLQNQQQPAVQQGSCVTAQPDRDPPEIQPGTQTIVDTAGPFTPVGDGHPHYPEFANLPEASADVRIKVSAYADLSESFFYVYQWSYHPLAPGWQLQGTALGPPAQGAMCDQPVPESEIVIPLETWQQYQFGESTALFRIITFEDLIQDGTRLMDADACFATSQMHVTLTLPHVVAGGPLKAWDEDLCQNIVFQRTIPPTEHAAAQDWLLDKHGAAISAHLARAVEGVYRAGVETCRRHYAVRVVGPDGFGRWLFCGKPSGDQRLWWAHMARRSVSRNGDPSGLIAPGFGAIIGSYHAPYWTEAILTSELRHCEVLV